ncbi:MAG TPA: thiol protease/hemagglutinin PrtT [Bacteroidia bacterium]|nr:thiol protease/hemagglutinin PrtT [Bacteroidia bacterium]
MRKIKFLFAALLFGSFAVSANPVAVNIAQKVAINSYNRAFNANASTESLVYTERSSDGQVVYYVFNVDNNKGFVIVSAEDATIPVIGYSNEGPFVMPVSGNNVDFWMTSRKNEIIAIRTQSIKATSEITNKWTSYINNTPEKETHADMSSVSPLCTTTWDQSPFYNQMCPKISSSQAVTGCVATAMAQIMKYWAYPKVGIGSWCYYDIPPAYTENYGQLCAKFDTSNYVWSAMPNNVTSANKEVAKLMYDCGVSVNMDYSPSGSGAFVIGSSPSAQYAYPTYFGYDAGTIIGRDYSSYTASAWEALLKTELNAGRPVQYMGSDASYGGHSWVCDGYNTGNDFHMNWGWSGYENGYYAVTSLNPSPYNFSLDQGALMGIQPPPGLAVPEISNNIAINVYPNPGQGIFTFEIPSNLDNSQLKVYNTIGQEVYSLVVSTGKYQVNLTNQPTGIYLYRLLNGNGSPVSTGKLIIQ